MLQVYFLKKNKWNLRKIVSLIPQYVGESIGVCEGDPSKPETIQKGRTNHQEIVS